MFIKIGDITGPKAWFWIVGELNYPVAALAYFFADRFFMQLGMKPWAIFCASVLVLAVLTPFYYERIGFALGVSLEARYL